MKNVLSWTGALIAICLLLSCSQTYYSTMFRLATVMPEDGGTNLSQLIDGPIDPVTTGTLTLRVVGLYSSNNKAKSGGNVFNVMIEQKFPEKKVDSALVDSLVFTFRPGGEKQVLKRLALRYYAGKSIPEPRLRSLFGVILIPTGVDTTQVEFLASAHDGESGRQITKPYSLTLVRWEGSYEKFGISPRDKD